MSIVLSADEATVRVELGARAYDIRVGAGLLDAAADHIKPHLKRPQTVIVTDETVAGLYLDRLQKALAKGGIASRSIVLPAGEQTKSFPQLERLLSGLLDMGVERSDTVIALGGGVIGDLTGFAASILRRGVSFIQIPTTLLAQVDSSVGGKTGINVAQGKNLVGSFHQPKFVLIDIAVLESLPERQFLAGYAEIVKYGLIDDPAFFQWLEKNGTALASGDRALRREAVIHACRAKAQTVAADERESGRRALLNLGHTFGHALEAETGYSDRLLHGEGVAIGMVLAFALSVKLGLCPADDLARVRTHLNAVGLPASPRAIAQKMTPEALLHHMAQDKKVENGRLTLILARGIGKSFITRDVADADILALLAQSLA
jgi:3-dehydroquinate synthase